MSPNKPQNYKLREAGQQQIFLQLAELTTVWNKKQISIWKKKKQKSSNLEIKVKKINAADFKQKLWGQK